MTTSFFAFKRFLILVLSALVGWSWLVAAGKESSSAPGGSPEPIRYIGGAQAEPDAPDGALPWAVGVQSYQVMHASRVYPKISDGQGWTYNHAPMITYWKGKFYVEFVSSPTGENGLPTDVLLSSSSNGRDWSVPKVVFPQWNSFKDPDHPYRSQLHQRMGFYAAPSGRLLVISHYGLWHNRENRIFGGPGHVVREIHEDGSLGPIYFVRYGQGWNASNTPYPFYKDSPDKGFVQACDALLANPFVTDQWYELEKGYPPDAYIRIAGPYKPDSDRREADHRRKALSFYHRKNGVAVGIWKMAWTAISSNGGKTWSTPVRASGLSQTMAKLWGQQTSDGRYAIAFDPQRNPPGHRWPLAVVTSDDGITFDHMLVVQGDVPLRRYPGHSKRIGPQYVRGIAEGNPQPPDGAMWLVYSMNKEDIWVSRIPVPIRGSVTHAVNDSFNNMTPGGVVTDWNIYSPRWAPVAVANFPSVENKSLELKDGDPYDYARAVKVFPASQAGELSFKILAKQTEGEMDIDVDDPHGRRPVRIVLAPNGKVEIANGRQMVEAATYTAGKWLAFKIDFDTENQDFSVAIDGRQVLKNAAFAEPVQNILQRISFSTGPHRTILPGQSGHQGVYTGCIDPRTDRPIQPRIYYLDDVSSQKH